MSGVRCLCDKLSEASNAPRSGAKSPSRLPGVRLTPRRSRMSAGQIDKKKPLARINIPRTLICGRHSFREWISHDEHAQALSSRLPCLRGFCGKDCQHAFLPSQPPCCSPKREDEWGDDARQHKHKRTFQVDMLATKSFSTKSSRDKSRTRRTGPLASLWTGP